MRVAEAVKVCVATGAQHLPDLDGFCNMHIMTFAPIAFFRRKIGMITFDQLKDFTELNPQDRMTDTLCFESAREYVCRFCGYEIGDEIPSEVTECLLHIFILKKRKMIASLNNEPFDDEMPKDIMDVLYHYMIQNGAKNFEVC